MIPDHPSLLRGTDFIWGMLKVARSDSPLADSSSHGERHWHDVAQLGLQLARADHRVNPFAVVLFGLFHDCRRQAESDDPGHGQRGAEALREVFRNTALPAFVELAITACELHDTGHVERDDPTIGACLDADRLLLPRVGIAPDPSMLSTAAAREHAVGASRLMMPEPNVPLVWSQRWIAAGRLRDRDQSVTSSG